MVFLADRQHLRHKQASAMGDRASTGSRPPAGQRQSRSANGKQQVRTLQNGRILSSRV